MSNYTGKPDASQVGTSLSGVQSAQSQQSLLEQKYAYTELSRVNVDMNDRHFKGLLEEMRTINSDERILRRQAFDRKHWHSTLEFLFVKNQLDTQGNMSNTSKTLRNPNEMRTVSKEDRGKASKNAVVSLFHSHEVPNLKNILEWKNEEWASFRLLEQRAQQKGQNQLSCIYSLPNENLLANGSNAMNTNQANADLSRLAALTAHGSGDGYLALGMVLESSGIGVDWLVKSVKDPRMEARNILQQSNNLDVRDGTGSWLYRPSSHQHMLYTKIARITQAELTSPFTNTIAKSMRRNLTQENAREEDTDVNGFFMTSNNGGNSNNNNNNTTSNNTSNSNSNTNINMNNSNITNNTPSLEEAVDPKNEEEARIQRQHAKTDKWGKKWLYKLTYYESNLSTSKLGKAERAYTKERDQQLNAEYDMLLRGNNGSNGNSHTNNNTTSLRVDSGISSMLRVPGLYGHGSERALAQAYSNTGLKRSTGRQESRNALLRGGETSSRLTFGLPAPAPAPSTQVQRIRRAIKDASNLVSVSSNDYNTMEQIQHAEKQSFLSTTEIPSTPRVPIEEENVFLEENVVLEGAAKRLSLLSAALSGLRLSIPHNVSFIPYLRALTAPTQFATGFVANAPILQTNLNAPAPAIMVLRTLGEHHARVVTSNQALDTKKGFVLASEAAKVPMTSEAKKSEPTRMHNGPLNEVPSTVRYFAKQIAPKLGREQSRIPRQQFKLRLAMAGLDSSLPFIAERIFRCFCPSPLTTMEPRDYINAIHITVHNDPLYRTLLLYNIFDLDDDGILTLHDVLAGMLLGLAKQFPGDYSMLFTFVMAKLRASTPALLPTSLAPSSLLDTTYVSNDATHIVEEDVEKYANYPNKISTSSMNIPLTINVRNQGKDGKLLSHYVDPSILNMAQVNVVELPPTQAIPRTECSSVGNNVNTNPIAIQQACIDPTQANSYIAHAQQPCNIFSLQSITAAPDTHIDGHVPSSQHAELSTPAASRMQTPEITQRALLLSRRTKNRGLIAPQCACTLKSGPIYAASMTPFWLANGPTLLTSRGVIIADYEDIYAVEDKMKQNTKWLLTHDSCICEAKAGEPIIKKNQKIDNTLAVALGLGEYQTHDSIVHKINDQMHQKHTLDNQGKCTCDCHTTHPHLHERIVKPREVKNIPIRVTQKVQKVPLPSQKSIPQTNNSKDIDQLSNKLLLDTIESDPKKYKQLEQFKARSERLLQVSSIRDWITHVHKTEISSQNVIITPMELYDMVCRWDNSDVIRLIQLALLFPDLRSIHPQDPDITVYAQEIAPWDARFRETNK